jgi:hypothetical protein
MFIHTYIAGESVRNKGAGGGPGVGAGEGSDACNEAVLSAKVPAICVSSYYFICVVRILLYMCPYTTICVHILLYMCPHTAICVLISYYFVCVCILLYMCPHTIYVSSY